MTALALRMQWEPMVPLEALTRLYKAVVQGQVPVIDHIEIRDELHVIGKGCWFLP